MPSEISAAPKELLALKLSNGLRIIQDHTHEVARTAVTLHYGVGFRSEPESKEGFAHLFEHLMFQGSQRVPKGLFYAQVNATAGYVNGTTHQDYTDYQHLIAPWDLERTLYFEADRMRAPQFTRAALREQLELVQQEIYFNTMVQPYAGFPWPKSSNLLFDDHANAHDGYGDMNRLRSVSLDECAEFFNDWYTPENAVLTITGPHNPDEVEYLSDRFFSAVPARSTKVSPPRSTMDLKEDREATFFDPNAARPGVSISYRIAGPDADSSAYLAFNALAKILSLHHDHSGVIVDIDAQTGYFGPFDARDPEVFNVVITVNDNFNCDTAIEVFDCILRSYLDSAAVEDQIFSALGILERQYILTGSDLLERCRFIGRSQLLFDTPNLLTTLPASIAALTRADIAGAARALMVKHRAVVRIMPQGRSSASSTSNGLKKTLDSISIPDGCDTKALALGWTSTSGLPTYSARKEPESTGLTESLSFSTLNLHGIAVAHCRESRSTLVELRLRFRAKHIGWDDPWKVQKAVDGVRGQLLKHYTASARLFDLDVEADGEMIQFSGRVGLAHLTRWFSTVGECISRDWPPLAPSPQEPARSLSMLSDLIARSLLVDAAGGDREGSGSSTASSSNGGSIFTADTANLVVIGNVDTSALEDAMAALNLTSGETTSVSRIWWPAKSSSAQAVEIEGSTTVITNYFSEPDDTNISEAARYLTAALYGGSSLSRIHRNPRLENTIARTGSPVSRRALAGRPVSMTRIIATGSTVALIMKEMRKEEKAFKLYPPAHAEISQAIRYCENELRNVSDSPRTKADYFANLMGRGVPLDHYHDIGAGLRKVTPDLISTTFDTIFSGERITVSVGDLSNLEG